VQTIREFDQSAGEICSRFVQKWGGTTIYRNADYLQWRIFENPYVRSIVRGAYHKHELLGWVAFALGDDGMGYLVDIMVPGDNTQFEAKELIRILLLEAVIGSRNMGAYGIRGWHVNNHPFDQLVTRVGKQIGFYGIKKGHSFVLYNCQGLPQRPPAGSFDDWFITRIFTEGVYG